MTQSPLVSDSTHNRSDVEAVRAAARPLSGAAPDYGPLMELIGAAPRRGRRGFTGKSLKHEASKEDGFIAIEAW
jgi:hypothetical protein